MITELRHAFRTLLRTPGFTSIALVTLALGIGANTAIFSIVHGVLLRPLPFGDPDRLVELWTATPGDQRGSHSARSFLELQRTNRTLARIAGYRATMVNVAARPGEVAQLAASLVTIDFFDVLGVQPLLGRTFSRRTDTTTSERVVVLSRSGWQQLFADDRHAVGQRVRINGEPHTVVGVLPAASEWPKGTQIWVLSAKDVPPSPLAMNDEAGRAEADDDVGYISAVARLKDAVSLAQAQDDIGRVSRELQRDRAAAEQRDIRIGKLHEQIVGDVRPALLVLQAAVGLVLLIACANVSSLLLARTSGRRRELAIRAALGARRGRLVRQLLTESLALGTAGGVAGLLLGAWLLALLTRMMPEDVPRREEISLDWMIALTTFGIGLASSVLFGSMPAMQGSRAHTASTLKDGGDRASRTRTRGRSVLVVAEIALTLILLVGAGLLVNSFLRLQQVDSGFRPDHATVMSIAVPEAKYPNAKAQTVLYEQLLDRLSHRPEVHVAAIGFPGPLRASNASASFDIEGRPASGRERPFGNIAAISSDYFAAMGIPLVSGRTFSRNGEAAPVAIVNQAFARKYVDGRDPVGTRVRFGDNEQAGWLTVVGLAGDARQLGLHAPAPPILYVSFRDLPLPFTNIVVRSDMPEATVTSVLRTELMTLEPQLSIGDTSALQTILDRSIDEPRSRSILLSAFAVLALALAAVGLYGLISFAVVERTREIGIRLALGAPRGLVLVSIVREGLVLTATGVAIGLIGAAAAARALSRFLFGIGAADPLTLVSVCVLLLAVALLATYIPSRRALRVDPIVALRTD